MIVAVHMDNLVIFMSSNNAAKKLKNELRKEFTITDLGKMKQIVGLEVI